MAINPENFMPLVSRTVTKPLVLDGTELPSEFVKVDGLTTKLPPSLVRTVEEL